MRYKPYSAYKDSGVEWLGEVPGHWGVAPFYSVAAERDESNTGMLEDNLLSLSYGRIIRKDINSNDGLLPESFETYQIVRPGDIVFRLTDLQNDQRSLRTAIVEETGIITSAYVATRPMGVDPRYLGQLLRAYDVTKVFYSMGGGLRQSMKYSDLKRLPLLLPPRGEQSAIATFLDRETTKLDTLIAKQAKLLELLQEKRQALISHAVTKGLNPDSPMKDSGVAWLGEVPAHWIVGPVKRFYTSLDGMRIPLSAEERGTRQGDYPYYGASGVIDHVDDFLFDEDLVLVSEDGANLLNRSTPIAFVANGKYWVNNHAHILKPLDGNLLFWAEAIETIDLTPVVSGSAQPKLTAEALMNLVIAVPPSEDERSGIEAFIRSETAKLDTLIEKSRRSIELMREHRTALISAAVTGKIDVRTQHQAAA